METKDVLLRLRTEKKMTQDELAEKVFVTRQAVSRWEKGETTPNVETLKLLSGVFDVYKIVRVSHFCFRIHIGRAISCP